MRRIYSQKNGMTVIYTISIFHFITLRQLCYFESYEQIYKQETHPNLLTLFNYHMDHVKHLYFFTICQFAQ